MNAIGPGLLLRGSPLRPPPANLDAEQALLGALLANNKAYERVSEFLAPEHFAEPVHGIIFRAISRRIECGKLVDAVTLRGEFEYSGALDEVGGTGYLAALLGALVGIINASEYGRCIHDAWLRRQLIEVGESVVNRAFGPLEGEEHLEAGDQVEAAEQALFALSAQGAIEAGPLGLDHAMRKALEGVERAAKSPGGVTGLGTGLRDLDSRCGGLHAPDLLILAGRPGMGKTALATKIAFGAAQALQRKAREAEYAGEEPAARPGTVAFFSLEMSAEQLAARLLSEEARVPGDRMRRGEVEQRDFDRFVEISRDLASLPLVIDDTAAITLSAMRTRCRRLQRTRGLALVVVDYLQLMRSSASARAENRVMEVSQITQGLKAMAKDLSVPVLALSQLSRAVESREDKRPQLSDLRESGSIEQDADAVMFIYRDEYYLQQREPKQIAFDTPARYYDAMSKWQDDMARCHNIAELLLAKQRHGPTGKIDLFFEAEFTRFGDLDLAHGDRA